MDSKKLFQEDDYLDEYLEDDYKKTIVNWKAEKDDEKKPIEEIVKDMGLNIEDL